MKLEMAMKSQEEIERLFEFAADKEESFFELYDPNVPNDFFVSITLKLEVNLLGISNNDNQMFAVVYNVIKNEEFGFYLVSITFAHKFGSL